MHSILNNLRFNKIKFKKEDLNKIVSDHSSSSSQNNENQKIDSETHNSNNKGKVEKPVPIFGLAYMILDNYFEDSFILHDITSNQFGIKTIIDCTISKNKTNDSELMKQVHEIIEHFKKLDLEIDSN
jgi:hypothetical protein